MRNILKALRHIDWVLIVPALYMVGMGLVIQYSIQFKTKGVQLDLDLTTQIGAFFVGLAVVVFMSFMRHWGRIGGLLYLVSILSLIAVLFFGETINGAQRWLSVGPLRFQPTELAKLTAVLVAAQLLSAKARVVQKYRRIALVSVVMLLPAALTALQPDLGSAIVFIAIWLSMLAVSQIKAKQLLYLLLAILFIFLLALPSLASYQQERINSFLNPNSDTSGANYNSAQASIAIGSGGIFGNGLDSGTQSQLNFLPSQHTDFIFAVVAEKLGLLGAGSVLFAFIVLVLRMGYQAWVARTQYNRTLITGMLSIIIFHALVNIGMNLNLLPVTGLPLPYLSYGGTFLTVVTIATGLVVVAAYREWLQQEENHHKTFRTK